MWWLPQLELQGFASGAEVMIMIGLLWNGDELTDLRLCALGFGNVMQGCVSCSNSLQWTSEPDTSVYLVVDWPFGILAVAVVTVGWELCGAVKMQRLIVNGGWDSESSAGSVLQMSWISSLDRVQANIRWWEWSEQ